MAARSRSCWPTSQVNPGPAARPSTDRPPGGDDAPRGPGRKVIGMIVDEASAQILAAVEPRRAMSVRRGISAVVATPREASEGRLAGGQAGRWHLHHALHRSVLQRCQIQIGPDGPGHRRRERLSAVLACRGVQAADQEMFRHVGVEAARGADHSASNRLCISERTSADRRERSGRAVSARRAHYRSGRDALQASPQGIELRPMGPVWRRRVSASPLKWGGKT